MAELFNPKTVEKLCRDIVPTKEQEQAAKSWLELLKHDELKDETKNYIKFAVIVLKDILGYPITKDDFQSDNVEFLFTNSEGKKIVCFEAKGTSTKDLHAVQHGYKKEQATPIKQTWNYIGKSGLDYGICTNYKEFILITKDLGYSKEHVFDFTSIESNQDKLKEFIGIFSKERIIDAGFVKELHEESLIEEQEFTNEFYKLYHETRLMLVQEFQENKNVSLDESVHYTQIFLNRLIFIFFIEDRGFISKKNLFRERIVPYLDLCTEQSTSICNQIITLFQSFNKGSKTLGVFEFNGGLFHDTIPDKISFMDFKPNHFFDDIRQHSELSKTLETDQHLTQIIKKHKQINPIISNLLVMDSFDFETEISVNILGHIFEQSISDLEDLKKDSVSKRKKDGVYYTPEHITEYICKNTIIPYLSKSDKTNVDDLITEYKDDLNELENKVNAIKILDPACGSGAFLMKAVDVLLEIHTEIQNQKDIQGYYTVDESYSLDKWNDITKMREIIENNICGVDINEESIKITQLGIFLKITTNEKKLPSLSTTIQHGNSLIEDEKIDSRAFVWQDKFPQILGSSIEEKGFDIVLGNPPYFNIETLGVKSTYANEIKNTFPEIWMDKSDILFYFIVKAIQLSKKHVGFIISNAFLFSDKAKKLRNYILENGSITKIVNFEQYHVFRDAGITTAIIFLTKDRDMTTNALILPNKNYNERELTKLLNQNDAGFDVSLTKNSVFALVDKQITNLNSKIDSVGTPLGDLCTVGKGMETALNKIFVSSEFQKKFPQYVIRKKISGNIIQRYHIGETQKYCLYVEDFKHFEDLPFEVRNYLQQHKNELSNRADKKRRKTNWWNFTFPLHKELYNLGKIWCSYRNKNNCFAYENTKNYVGLTNTTVVFATNSNVSLLYVLTLLNSTLLNFRYKSIGKRTGDSFEYFENGIRKIPIPEISLTRQKTFIEKASQLQDLYDDFYKTQSNLFKRLFDNFKIVKTKKLEMFQKLDFGEFFIEMSKQNKKVTLEQQDELESYFTKTKNELFQTKGQIDLIEHEINTLVYDLYKINSDEITLIENNLS